MASTLASGTQERCLDLDVLGDSSQDFEITVSMANETHSLREIADSNDKRIPSPPAVPPPRCRVVLLCLRQKTPT